MPTRDSGLIRKQEAQSCFILGYNRDLRGAGEPAPEPQAAAARLEAQTFAKLISEVSAPSGGRDGGRDGGRGAGRDGGEAGSRAAGSRRGQRRAACGGAPAPVDEGAPSCSEEATSVSPCAFALYFSLSTQNKIN